MSGRVLLLAVVCAIGLCFSPMVYGQAIGSFSGTVSDQSGSVIAGATVRVTSEATGLSREGKTDDAGHYLIPLLPVTIYTIHVEFQGFQPAERKDVRLQIDEQRELDFTLAPASVASQIEVSATSRPVHRQFAASNPQSFV